MLRRLILLAFLSVLSISATFDLPAAPAADQAASNASKTATTIEAQNASTESLEGTLIAVNRPYRTMTFRLSNGATRRLRVSEYTILIRNNRMAHSVHYFKVGDYARATYRSGTSTATGINATGR